MKKIVILLSFLVASSINAQELKFGYPSTPAGAFAIVANKLDIWKKYQLNISLVEQAAAINVRDALVGGSLDVGFVGLSNFVVAVAAGAPMVTIGVAVDQCAATALVVKKNSPIKSIADLRGKKVGSEVATVTHGSLTNGVLPKSKLSTKEIQIVNVRFRDMISALLSDSVDAVTAVEPFLSQAENAGSIRVLTDFCPFAPVPVLIATSKETLEKKAASEKLFMSALLEVAQVFAKQPEKAAQIYGEELRAKGFDIPQPVVLQIIKRLNISPDRVRLSPNMLTYLQDEAQRMKASGQIDAVPDLKGAIDLSIAGK
jgi:sulfonate transport system substrate-binding protein